jgi:hypothetical protein
MQMKQLRRLALGALATTLIALGGVSSASATFLEVGGAAKNEEVKLEASLKAGTFLNLTDTGGGFINRCTASTVEGKTEAPFTGTTVGGKVSALSFSSCLKEGVVVDQAGSLSVEHIAGTTNGTVRSVGAQVTVPSSLGTLTCVTAASPGTDIGTLTGVASGNATMDINAVLNCGFFLPSAKWEGSYSVTSPGGLGITSTPPSSAKTSLEVSGVSKGEPVTINASLKSGTTLLLSATGGGVANTCTASTVEAKTEAPFFGTTVGGKVSALSFSSCTKEGVVVDETGSLSVEHIAGTTNGTVRSTGAKVTTPSFFGALTCATSNTDIGTLTGVASGNATMDINAVLNCGIFLPSAKWEGSYSVTSPGGLGITSTPPPPAETSLEVSGVSKGEPVAINASLEAGISLVLSATGGGLANTCTASTVEGKTEAPFTGTTVGGKVSALSFSSCTKEGVVVDEAGSLSVEHIAGTTNGTVRSTGAKVTLPSFWGSLTCVTSNTDIGTLTGVAAGNATMNINAVLNCGFFLTSAKWEGSYSVTSPGGLGITS